MSVNIGDLVATLSLNTSKFENGGKAAERTVARLEKMMNTATQSTKKLNDALSGLGGSNVYSDQSRKAEALAKSLANVSTVADGAGVSFSGLGRVSQALASPLGMAALAAGAFAGVVAGVATAVKLGTDAIVENAKEVKALMAVSGLGAEEADNFGDTMKLLGVNTQAASTALFRLGNEVDTGGSALRKLGVSVEKSSGELKTEGELFLEVRDRISQLGTAGQRSAALIDIFGRSGRELAPIFALNRDKFKEYMDEASKLSPWSEEAQQKTQALIIQQNKLGMQWDALKEHIGSVVVGPMTDFLAMINAAVDRMKLLGVPGGEGRRSGGIVLSPDDREPLSPQIPGEFGMGPGLPTASTGPSIPRFVPIKLRFSSNRFSSASTPRSTR